VSSVSREPGRGIGGAVISLRDATTDDLSFLQALFAGGRAAELAQTGWTDAQKRAFCDRQYALQDRHYREHFAGARCQVVQAGGTPIGRLYRATVDRTLYLLDIALVAQSRGQGVGTMLMNALVAEADRDAMSIVLHVEPDNPAKRLYERLGFVAGAMDGVYCEMTRRPAAGPAREGGDVRTGG
jgi:ribosomal protein S18 acetylase RimI-like enzyme